MSTFINSTELILSGVGVIVVYLNSPLHYSKIDGGDANTDFERLEKEAARKNRLAKYGVFMVLTGTALQLLSNFIPK